ncbi:hypothetical protein BUE80_DR013342 [Diplocarpon rosae]|nr:hypothetical protein BUE80_DR013342 [Diplocarpon rosae]
MVLGHGALTSPPTRAVGPAMDAACGPAVAALVRADNTSHVEDMPEAAARTPNFNATACNVFLCRGQQFADNQAHVQNFTAGEVVNMRAVLPILHEGPMVRGGEIPPIFAPRADSLLRLRRLQNVSVVKTATNTALGAPLISFNSYADESLPTLPANNTNFNVTVPSDLGSECAVAGACSRYRKSHGGAGRVGRGLGSLDLDARILRPITPSNVSRNEVGWIACSQPLLAPFGGSEGTSWDGGSSAVWPGD